MLQDNETKNELHQRSDDLIDKMWSINENRKLESIEEKTSIINNN